MSDFGAAVKQLVDFATKGGKDWQLREAAYEVLQAFDPADARGAKPALKALGAGVREANSRGQQILLLALGALAEAGASPELVWPAVEYNLAQTLNDATEFANACVDAAETPDIPEAVKIAAEKLKKKYPRHHESWEMLRSRCLTACACLVRSPELRKKARASKDGLLQAAAGLDDLVEEVTFVNHALKLIDDVPLLVLHPDSRRGWRMVMNDVSTNVEMFVLLLDVLIGDPKKGMLEGVRPSSRAVSVVRDPTKTPKTPPEIKVLWNLVGYTGVMPDLTLPSPRADDAHPHWVWLEGVPLDIPVFEGERVILLQPPVMKRSYEVDPAFSSLRPRLELKSKIAGPEVERLLAKMAPAAAKWRAKKAKEDEALARRYAEEATRELRESRRRRGKR